MLAKDIKDGMQFRPPNGGEARYLLVKEVQRANGITCLWYASRDRWRPGDECAFFNDTDEVSVLNCLDL